MSFNINTCHTSHAHRKKEPIIHTYTMNNTPVTPVTHHPYIISWHRTTVRHQMDKNYTHMWGPLRFRSPGIGKSRLLAGATDDAQPRGTLHPDTCDSTSGAGATRRSSIISEHWCYEDGNGLLIFLCCARGVRHPPTLYFSQLRYFCINVVLVHCSDGPDETSALPTSYLGSTLSLSPGVMWGPLWFRSPGVGNSRPRVHNSGCPVVQDNQKFITDNQI